MLKDYLYKKPTIDTERLQLRPLRPEDAEDMRLWTPEKGMYTYWGKSAGKADKHPEMLFAATEKPSKSLHLGIVRREDDRVIGEVWVYLIEKDRMAKLALRIGAPFQNAGLPPRPQTPSWHFALPTRSLCACGQMRMSETSPPGGCWRNAASRERG